MKNQDFTATFSVHQTPQQAFDAINNVRGWWTDNMEGNSEKLNDEFSVSFWDIHYSKQKLTEVIPGKKVVWLVTGSNLTFLRDAKEWNGTQISFDISERDGKTQVSFTHTGLIPEIECFRDCSTAWTGYITGSLYNLITTGKGQPTLKDD